MASHANSTSAPKFDRAAIMKAAWQLYREAERKRATVHGPRPFRRDEFAWRLQIAWADVKYAALSPAQQRRAGIEAEIDRLRYMPAHMNVMRRRAELQSELAALAA